MCHEQKSPDKGPFAPSRAVCTRARKQRPTAKHKNNTTAQEVVARFIPRFYYEGRFTTVADEQNQSKLPLRTGQGQAATGGSFLESSPLLVSARIDTAGSGQSDCRVVGDCAETGEHDVQASNQTNEGGGYSMRSRSMGRPSAGGDFKYHPLQDVQNIFLRIF